MLSLYCTAVGLINKNEKHIIPDKITNSRYLKELAVTKGCNGK